MAVRDLAIHPRDNDLVIATHGRGIWIIDDITPLRALTPGDAGERRRVRRQSGRRAAAFSAFGGWVNGDAAFVGANPPDDAVITYYQRKRHIFGDMKLEVLDSAGKRARHDAEQQAARPEPRDVVDAHASRRACRRGNGRVRRVRRARACFRAPTR